jgi:hypothetical protein
MLVMPACADGATAPSAINVASASFLLDVFIAVLLWVGEGQYRLRERRIPAAAFDSLRNSCCEMIQRRARRCRSRSMSR